MAQTKSGIHTFEDLSQEKCSFAEVDTQFFPKNRSQYKLEWCHAYGLSDLMSFYTKQTISAYGIAAASYKRRVLDLGIDHGNISTFKSNPSTDFAQIALTEKKLCLESNFIKNDSDWQNLSRSIYDLDDKKLSDKTLICSKAYNNFISSIDEKIINALKKLSGSNFIAAADDYIQRELSKK